MRAVSISKLSEVETFPVDFIVNNEVTKELTGCAPLSLMNFCSLLGLIDKPYCDFLTWLQNELREDRETRITPVGGMRSFLENPIFEKIKVRSGLVYDVNAIDFLYTLSRGGVLFGNLYLLGTEKPSHCTVFHIKEGKLFSGSQEISVETFVQKLFCHPENWFIIGKRL